MNFSLLNKLNVFESLQIGGASERLSKESKQMVDRWLDVLHNHGLRLDHIPRVFCDLGISIGDVASDRDISKLLDDRVLNQTAELFNVQRSYLDGDESSPYDVELLDREPDSIIRCLSECIRSSGRAEIVVVRSGKHELEENWHQRGSILIRTRVFDWSHRSVYRYTPVFSLQDWWNPKQRFLAIRAMWIARKLGCKFWGDQVSERQALQLSNGEVFPESVLSDLHPKRWYPDEYVVRPSAVAKGGAMIDAYIRDFGKSDWLCKLDSQPAQLLNI